jgi:DDE superfamily endonuclease
VQELQFFLSESTWDHERVNQRRIELLLQDPATRPHEQGVLVIDDTGDRKAGTATAHVARQYLGSLGKTDNGIVAVTSLWADERVYWPAHVTPYTPAGRLPKGKTDPGFRTKPQLAAALVQAARQAQIAFRAVVADCVYGDNEGFTEALGHAGVAHVLAVKPLCWRSSRARGSGQGGLGVGRGGPHPAGSGARAGLEQPGRARRLDPGHSPVPRRAHRDLVGGRRGAARGRLGPGPAHPVGCGRERTRQVVRAHYLVSGHQPAPTPAPTRSPAGTRGVPVRRPGRAGAPVVRLYGLRNWVEQGYKQVKHELGWADFQVRADRAIRRHWQLVACAFSFCWQAWFAEHPAPPAPAAPADPATMAPAGARRGETRASPQRSNRGDGLVAEGAALGAGLADPVQYAAALLAGVVASAPAAGAATAA